MDMDMENGLDLKQKVPQGGSRNRKLLLNIFLVVGFSTLTVTSAMIRIPLPFTPVPINLQTFIVLLAGAMLGSVRGGLSQILYLLLGIIGMPFFGEETSGFALLAGPTGGYLIGFVFGAVLVGAIMRHAGNFWTQAGVFTVGTVVILFLGWINLTVRYMDGDPIKGLTYGVIPFIPGAVIKILLSAGVFRGYQILAIKKARD